MGSSSAFNPQKIRIQDSSHIVLPQDCHKLYIYSWTNISNPFKSWCSNDIRCGAPPCTFQMESISLGSMNHSPSLLKFPPRKKQTCSLAEKSHFVPCWNHVKNSTSIPPLVGYIPRESQFLPWWNPNFPWWNPCEFPIKIHGEVWLPKVIPPIISGLTRLPTNLDECG